MASIDNVFQMLSWDNDESIRQQGIKEAKKIAHLSVLFQPIESKSVWENCAKVIASKSDETLEKYLFQMFEWLQDMNWPGAEIIYHRLSVMPKTMLEKPFQYSLKMAKTLNDISWIRSLLAFQQDLREHSLDT